MIDTIAMIFGMTFVGIILICLVFTIGDFIVRDIKMKRHNNNNN